MKQCHQYHPEMLSRLVDNALTPRESARIREHLACCPHCRDWVDRYGELDRQVGPALEGHLAAQGRPDLEASVIQALFPPSKASVWHRLFRSFDFLKTRKFYLQVASFAAILILGTLFLQDRPLLPPQSDASAIVTTIDGNAASVMILETRKQRHTIIWYQEG